MDVKFVETTNGPQNWGKFAVLRFDDDDWKQKSAVDGRPLLAGRGWGRDHVMVVDLQTGEGAFFFAGGIHKSDLDKHAIWVCPMYEATLRHVCDGEHDPMKTEDHLDFPDEPFEYAGYRRQGPDSDIRVAAAALSEAWDKYIGVGELEGDDDVDAVAQAMFALRIALYGGSIEDLIERSSLGTPEAKAIRAQTPPEVRDEILRRVAEGDHGPQD